MQSQRLTSSLFYLRLLSGVLCLALAVTFVAKSAQAQAQSKTTPARAAAAQAPAAEPTQVLVILAGEEAGEVAPELKKIEALQKPPFSAFKSMKVLSKSPLSAAVGKPVEVTLPNGRKMQVELMEVESDGRFKVRVSINKPDAKDYLPGMVVKASPGEPFFVAGQKHQGGTLIVGITVGKK